MTISFTDDKSKGKINDAILKEEEQLVEAMAANNFGLPYINLAGMPLEADALKYIPETLAREAGIAPFKAGGKHIHIALRSPENKKLDEIRHKLKDMGMVPHFYLASLASLNRVYERYTEISHSTISREGGIDISSETLTRLGLQIKTMQDVSRAVNDVAKLNDLHSTSRLLEIILAGAIVVGASDIHIEPEEGFIRLRYRLDGVLEEIAELKSEKYHLINSRLKLLSGLKLTQTNSAQDGRFSIFYKNEEIGIRTSTVPGAYGEGIVMRLLDPKITQVKFEDLGIEPKLFAILDEQIKKPHGLILITGPTGSGKTATLYSFLRRIYSSEIKIITVEDPIEFHLPGITQTQADEKYVFADAVRAAVRQDPEVCMVGEIRDKETAGVAINFALTGHMVFSTLHTNSAAGVIPRLIDLGANPKILVSALSVSMAQRLVRRLCPFCKQKTTIAPDPEKQIVKILDYAKQMGKDMASYGINITAPFEAYEAVGCDKCNFTGYKGRIGVFEAILTDNEMANLIPTSPSEHEIEKVANKQGILNMREDGILKLLKGITSYEEVLGAVDLNFEE
ncbi:MAG: type II/IV secretion system protein [Candidatus Pacebacteria bacterium]|nr:type II/IV secretion system protein [Candidatus Paceibacterota bacterium]